jgi:hypothetical protein
LIHKTKEAELMSITSGNYNGELKKKGAVKAETSRAARKD